MIEITGLKKSFGNLKVLEDINVTINDGEIYGLVGRSGAGKSTLLRCINGLENYDEGSLSVNGIEVKDLSKKEGRVFRKNIGMIFQHFSLLERRTVYDNIALPMRCWKYSKTHIDKRVKELVELVGIPEKIHDKPRVLSGGQKQRGAIARALAMESRILLCDEATSALDPKTTQSILSLLLKINEQFKITMVVVTHQMSVVKDLCDRISILEEGRLASTGRVEDVFLNQPPALKRLLGEDEFILPDDGVNIKIILSTAISGGAVISRLSRQLDTDILLVGAHMERYKDKLLGTLIINVSKNKAPAVMNYFTQNKLPWEILDSENNRNEAFSSHPEEKLEEAALRALA